MRSRTITAMATLALVASVIGAYAQTTTNANPNGSHVIQGDFENGTPTTGLLQNNGNSKRVGNGGSNPGRMNMPIWGLDLPPIPAGESLSAATLTVDVTSISGSPLFFEVVASLMNAEVLGEFSAADFVQETAPLDSELANGIVFAQFDQSQITPGETLEIPVTGAALTQLGALYDASGNPSQSTVWFRLSPSITNDWSTSIGGDRIQFADNATNSTFAAFGLELNWGSLPEFSADPVVKANVTWGSDYATLSQTLDGSASNPAGDPIFYEKTGGPAWLVVASNGALSGIADVVGTNEFPIRAFTDEGDVAATLQIVVDTVGNPPEFTMDVIEKLDGTFGEDYALLSETLDGSATDVDGDTLIYSRAGGGPGWLNVASNGVLSGTCDVLGTNTFPIQVTDGNGNFDAASLVIVVQTVGSPPEFTVDPILKADGEFTKDYALESQTLEGSATDVDGDTLTYSKTGGPAWLNVASNGVLSGVCAVVGTNSFTVEVDDGNGNGDTAELLIYVAPLPVGELIVGMDAFSSTTVPAVTYMASGIDASATASAAGTANWAINDGSGRGSSKDGTWGTHEGPPAASDITDVGPANFTLTNAKTDGEITITVINTGSEDLELGQFHFDAVAFRPKAARTFALNVLAGSDISTGTVFASESQAITSLNGQLKTDDADPLTHDQHDDIGIILTDLADNVLEAGGTAIIQLAFSGGAGDNAGGHHLFVDNIGISLAGAQGAPDSPVLTITASGSDVIVSWTSDRDFRLQSKPQLSFGDWVDVPGGDSSPVTVPATMDAEFFSLLWEE